MESEKQEKLNKQFLKAIKAKKSSKAHDLLNKGADLYAKDENGETALDLSKKNGWKVVINFNEL